MSEIFHICRPKPELEIIKKPDNISIKLFGIKVQDDGTLARPDDIYKIMVSDFIVEFDRNTVSNFSNKTVASMIETVMVDCKKALKLKDIKVISSHMRSNPALDQPHILITILADDIV